MNAQRMQLEGVSFLARQSGRSRAWLLCHGFTGSPASWDEVADRLCPESDVFALELPGHGGREENETKTSFPRLVQRLATVLPKLHQGPVYLGGYSMGGRLALALAVAHPRLVRGLVLLGASPGLRGEEERRQRRSWDQSWVQILRQEGLSSFIQAWHELPLFASQASLSESRGRVQRRIRAGHNAEGLAMALEGLGLAAMPNLWPQLQNLDMPVRLVVGERDEKFFQLAEAMVEDLALGKVIVIPDVGHNVVMEAPEATMRVFEEMQHHV